GAISGTYRFTGRGLSQNINGAILNEVNPGMSFSAAIGLAYAISYALSMNIQFQYGYSMSTDYSFTNTADMTIPAYSTGTLVIGMGWRISPKTTPSFSLGIGLTKDDPDFFLLFRLPFTF
ncbi:MAG TPA: flagellar protein FilC, partial [Syntrophaceae bacterium]|nr:flagellar protein FilC [Syntrophaceae bacterium]